MFKNKNKVTKISNAILLVIFVLYLVASISSIISIATGNITLPTGYTEKDYLYSTILSLVYAVLAGISLLILNTKVNMYKEDYTLSRQIFNLYTMLSIISSLVLIASYIVSIYVYKESSTYELLTSIICYIPFYIAAYIYVDKKDLLNKKNTKIRNTVNFLVVCLMMSYFTNIVSLVLQYIFKVTENETIYKNLMYTIIWMALVIIAYKLIDRNDAKRKEIEKYNNTTTKNIEKVVETKTDLKEAKIEETKPKSTKTTKKPVKKTTTTKNTKK